MKISMIAAMSRYRLIGSDNLLPWDITIGYKNHFESLIIGKPLIIGRKTHESAICHCNNKIIVLSGLPGKSESNITFAQNKIDALTKAKQSLGSCIDEVIIVGGSQIYDLFWDYADTLYITIVHGTFRGNLYFPKIDQKKWRLVSKINFGANSQSKYRLDFEKYNRK